MIEVTIIGHVGNDAVVKDFNGKKYIAFNIAHSEKYTDRNGQPVEKTTWVSCLKPGESNVVNYIKKGTALFVRGDLSVKAYTNQQGQMAAGINCLVRNLQLLPGGTRSTDGQQGTQPMTAAAQTAARPAAAPATTAAPSSQQPAQPAQGGGSEDDLPF